MTTMERGRGRERETLTDTDVCVHHHVCIPRDVCPTIASQQPPSAYNQTMKDTEQASESMRLQQSVAAKYYSRT